MLVNTDFGDDLIGELIPHVDGNFRTLADADHRAMAGLSMGGAHTLNYGVPRPDLFGEVGMFSMGLGFRSPAEVEQLPRPQCGRFARTRRIGRAGLLRYGNR